MPRNSEGMLDDIGAASAEAPAPAKEPAAEPVRAEPEPARTEADAPEREKPAKPDPANSPERPDGYVPRQAIDRIQGELRAERQARERAEANFQKFLDRWHADQEPAPAEPEIDLGPDPDEDPIGALKWARDQRARDLEERRQREAQRSQQTEQQRQMEALYQAAAADVRQFKAQTPDYDDACRFYWNQRGPELMALGYTQEQAAALIKQDEEQIAALALQRRQSPAETFYRIAKARGYQGKAPAVAAQPAGEDEAGRELPERDPTTGKFVSTEAEKAARIKESQERNGSLTQAPGMPVEKMTAKELAKMSEADMWRHFDRMKGRKGSKEFDRAMGFR